MPLRIILFNVVLLGACLYAVWRGGEPERRSAWLMAGAAALTASAPYLADVSYKAVNPAVLIIDLAFFIGITGIAARADRFWPMWAAALQLLALAVHVVRSLDPTILPAVYNQALGKVAYPILALLVIGTSRHYRRSKSGEQRDWSPFLW